MSELVLTVVSPLANVYGSLDYCRTCYTLRRSNFRSFRDSKIAQMAILKAYTKANSFGYKEFKEALDKLDGASEKCCSVIKPDENCHKQNQKAINQTLKLLCEYIEKNKGKLGL